MRELFALCKKITSIKTHLRSYNALEILLDGVYICVSVCTSACMCLVYRVCVQLYNVFLIGSLFKKYSNFA